MSAYISTGALVRLAQREPNSSPKFCTALLFPPFPSPPSSSPSTPRFDAFVRAPPITPSPDHVSPTVYLVINIALPQLSSVRSPPRNRCRTVPIPRNDRSSSHLTRLTTDLPEVPSHEGVPFYILRFAAFLGEAGQRALDRFGARGRPHRRIARRISYHGAIIVHVFAYRRILFRGLSFCPALDEDSARGSLEFYIFHSEITRITV